MTLDQVKQLTYRQTIYHKTLRNADHTPLRARVNGKLKLWKRDPARFQLPMKTGLRQCFYLTPTNVAEWQPTSEPL